MSDRPQVYDAVSAFFLAILRLLFFLSDIFYGQMSERPQVYDAVSALFKTRAVFGAYNKFHSRTNEVLMLHL